MKTWTHLHDKGELKKHIDEYCISEAAGFREILGTSDGVCDVSDMRSKLKLLSWREISAWLNKSQFWAQATWFKEWVQRDKTTVEDML